MINEFNNPRPDLTFTKFEQLNRLSEPALPTLAKFVHSCSKNPNERTLAVTLFVTTLCQLSGKGMMQRVPSTIVVNALELSPDPVDLLARFLIPEPSKPVSGLCRNPNFLGGSAKDAPSAMEQAIHQKQKLRKITPLNAGDHKAWENRFFAAQTAGFGSGPSRRYAKAWNENFGLLTGRGNELILRIDSAEDRLHFCSDVVKGVGQLREPIGYGANLTLVPKRISFSGSLPSSDWNAPLAMGLVQLGLPLLVLPSLAEGAPAINNDAVLRFIAGSMPKFFSEPVDEPANLLQMPWFRSYGEELRARLHHLPDHYEYAMQKLARQLFPSCLRIASWCGTFSDASAEEIMAITKDLCGHTLRGMVISVAGLAWHGLGFDGGCTQATVIRVLEYLRAREPITKSQLLRGTHIEKQMRDTLLERLEAENLVTLEGKVVRALSYPEFVEALYARKDLPPPENHWAQLSGMDRPAA